MRITASIDPVTRIEGHMAVEVAIDTVNGVQQVVDAKSVGTLFRGMEKILVGRSPGDAQHITERICGVCPTSHAMAAVMTLDKACKVTVPTNGRILRNLVMASNFVDSHILHFYLLAALDYLQGPNMPPWQPNWNVDMRLDAATTQRFVDHYLQAIAARRKAQEMLAVFGGKTPHPPTYAPGGFTAKPTQAMIDKFRNYLNEVQVFVETVYLPDVQLLASKYADYYNVGRGPGNLLAFGCFDLDSAGTNRLLKRGLVTNGGATVSAVDAAKINEHVAYSWYNDSTSKRNPAQGLTEPVFPKTRGYTWMKAPRYADLPYETGALARMWVNGDYRRGISVMDRHAARAQETLKIIKGMQSWVTQISLTGAVFTRPVLPTSTVSSSGLTEAPRGALGHWMTVASQKISAYQVITPTCWNCSPRDDSGRLGPLESALMGTPVKDAAQPIEVMRVIRSFDPCLDCAVHVVRAKDGVAPSRVSESEMRLAV